MQNNTERQVLDLIKRKERILVLPSSPVDGDSIGTALALYLALKKLGKEATVVCSEAIPDLLQFLPSTKVVGKKVSSSNDFIVTLDCKNAKVENIKSFVENNKINIVISPLEGRFSEDDISFNKGEVSYDLIITVDTADLSQLKSIYENNIEMFHQIPVINIDHHISNAHFGKVNYIDIMASSTAELLLPILEKLANEEEIDLIDEDIATLLLTGIITDTGSFQNANTTPKSFAVSAQLISYGARQQEIIQHVYKTKQLSQLKLWGRVLSKIQTDKEYRIVWSSVSQQDFRDTESTEDETGDIIDELMTNAPGAEVILLLKERKNNIVSVSIRTTTSAIDGSKIAEHFGGGGHTQAAGFSFSDLSLMNAEHQIIEYVRKIQSQRLGVNTESEEIDPIIDVEGLMNKAEETQKAMDSIEKIKTKKTKKKKKTLDLKTSSGPKESEETIYKFED